MKRKLLCILAALPTLIWPAPPSRLAQSRILTVDKPRGRALLVGVNQYQFHPDKPTPGAVEDAEAIRNLLLEKKWFDAGEIRMLLGSQATAANIEREFREWLIKGTGPGDRVFFLYSGHGTQAPDDDGDERLSDSGDYLDEAIAPYDVNVANDRLVNIIRDDQFNNWLGRLGGRSIVMVFDSCHSGAVSRGAGVNLANNLGPRYLPTPGQLRQLPRVRSATDGGYVVSDGPPGRDLKLTLDKKRLAPNSALAVFSAARSHQLAYPIRTPEGGVRGAFSYYIEQALRAGNPTLRDLRRTVEDNIKRAQRTGLLKGSQAPDFEISAPSLMEDQPLFGAAGAPAQLPLLAEGFANTASKLSLTARLGYLKDGRFLTDRKVFCFGEKIGYRIHTGSRGYLYLIVFSRNDVVTLIYPGEGEQEEFEAGEHSLDGFQAQEPEGKDVIVALLTKDRLALKDHADNGRPMTWKDAFALLGSAELEQSVRTRGRGGRLKGRTLAETDWQATILMSEAVENCDRLPRK